MFSNSFHQAKKKPLFSMKRAKMEDFSPLLPPVPKDGRERKAKKERVHPEGHILSACMKKSCV